MTGKIQPVVILFAFADDRVEGVRFPRDLSAERRQLRAAMQPAIDAGHCQIVERAAATVDDIVGVFRDESTRGRVAVVHYGGHAGSARRILETAGGEIADAGRLATLLGEQPGLELVFLNACASQGLAQRLLDAGVPAVITTSQAIRDPTATELAAGFYRALAAGDPIRTAFEQTTAAISSRVGSNPQESWNPGTQVVERWPWDIGVEDGAADHIASWSLPLAAGDPLAGLPEVPATDLPAAPFKHLSRFTRDDARIFFGRGREIRDLYQAVTRPGAAPIVLLLGAAGTGKSSLLDAGLGPRLEAGHAVVYRRRDKALGLAGTLASAVGAAEGTTAGVAWRQHEAASEKPLVVMLDQVEEACTRPDPARPDEVRELAASLREIFAAPGERPRGRLVLGLQADWLAEIRGALDAERLPHRLVEIQHLDRDGIVDAVAGPASVDELKQYYRLGVEPELPGIIAYDLLEHPGAAVAPQLQILLTEMWQQATADNGRAPRFTTELYQGLRPRSLLLEHLFDDQLESLRAACDTAVASGLVLDLLAYHTTAAGNAETRPAAVVVEHYLEAPVAAPGGGGNGASSPAVAWDDGFGITLGRFLSRLWRRRRQRTAEARQRARRQEVEKLIEHCRDRRLLDGKAPARQPAGGAGDTAGTTRLAHATLAPIVRRRFETSDRPGQRARRILARHTARWARGEKATPLAPADLATVVAGESGMRARTADEQRWVEVSHGVRLGKNLATAGVAAAVALGLIAIGGEPWVALGIFVGGVAVGGVTRPLLERLGLWG